MSSDRDRFRVALDIDPAAAERSMSARERPTYGPFRIALVGDFSGRASRSGAKHESALHGRRPLRIDRDTLDDSIAQLRPKLELTIASDAQPIEITFNSLDDFHPDSLYSRLPFFRAIRDAAAPTITSSTSTAASVLDAILGGVPTPPGGAAVTQPVAQRATASPGGG